MTFASLAFLAFALVFFALWRTVEMGLRARWFTLTAFSLVFYGWYDWRYVLLLVANGLIDFVAALVMVQFPRYRKPILFLSILSNVLILASFKYATFLTSNVASLFHLLGLRISVPVIYVNAPAGISFYTFQGMSYTIEVYRGRLKPTRDILHYFAYLSMFPQLVAGPIVRASEMLPQLLKAPVATEQNRWEGLRLLVHGFFKKLVIADNLVPGIEYAAAGFHVVSSAAFWWIIVVMIGLQIYYDFSGYSDIARGLAKWMGYELPVNFNHPFLSTSLRQFWSRWNITVTHWFRDYVYYSLQGSHSSRLMSIRNLWITMALVGFWHGSDWTFIVFGLLHAAQLSIERVFNLPRRLRHFRGGRMLSRALVIFQLTVSAVFFKAPTIGVAVTVLERMFHIGPVDWRPILWLSYALPFAAIGIIWEVLVLAGLSIDKLELSERFRRWEPALLVLMVVCCVYARGPGATFVYFQF